MDGYLADDTSLDVPFLRRQDFKLGVVGTNSGDVCAQGVQTTRCGDQSLRYGGCQEKSPVALRDLGDVTAMMRPIASGCTSPWHRL